MSSLKKISFGVSYLLIFFLMGCRKDSDPQQAFIKYFGGPYMQTASSVIKTTGGDGYLIVGSTSSHSGGTDVNVFVVRTDLFGNEVWSRPYGNSDFNEYGTDVKMLPDGSGYIISATAVDSDGNSDAYLFKINQNNEIEWENRVSSGSNSYETVSSLDISNDGNIVFTGNIRPKDASIDELDTYIYKLNQLDGTPDTNWKEFRIWGYEGTDSAVSIKTNQDGGFTIFGLTQHSSLGQGESNFLVYTTNDLGIVRDVQSFGTLNKEEAGGFYQHRNDSYTLIGASHTSDKSSIYLQKTAPRLIQSPRNPINVKLDNPNLSYSGIGVAELSEGGGYIIGGNVQDEDSQNIFLSLIDENGNQKSNTQTEYFGLSGDAIFGDLIEVGDGFVICGTFTFGSNTMMGLVKVSSQLSMVSIN